MNWDFEQVVQSFQPPEVPWWTLRLSAETGQSLAVRQDILQPLTISHDFGAMVSVAEAGGSGYAATSDLSTEGLARASGRARDWARATAAFNLLRPDDLPRPQGEARYGVPMRRPWEEEPLERQVSLLLAASRALKAHPHIVDWGARIEVRSARTLLLSSDGAHLEQGFLYLNPGLAAVANRGAQTQRRTHGNGDTACQGGLEQLERIGFADQAERVAAEALALLDAPECPTGVMDVLLLPGQMILQIHESIGHPLELDRILGDERNYAGTSFVTPEMFGRYRYGSDHLNVVFDPTVPHELASYAYDDEGTVAERQFLIRDGILQRPLGGAISQARAGLPGVANARACSWNRPPIDRMANLNLVPGDQSLATLAESIERGVLMDTNRSWSIDDRRNKFQFGCEYGRLIRDGELRGLVRNPSYRGVSGTFWRSLSGVGDGATVRVLGTPNCGKGEPNQVIRVGHAAPACAFRAVEVFGA